MELPAGSILDDQGLLDAAAVERRVGELAGRLAAAGVAAGDRVAWSMHNRAEVLLVALAAQRAGAVVVALSYRSSVPELGRMLELARPAAVVVEAATAAAVAAAAPPGPPVLDVDHPAGPAAPPAATARRGPDRLGAGASMLFTSGTTGAPKAALRVRGDGALARAIADGLGFRAGSRYLASGPLYHSGPWTCALMALSRGGSVVLRRRFDAAGWLAAAREHGVTASFCTPTLLRRLVEQVEAGSPAPGTLVNVVVSGEPFPVELKRRAVAALGPCLLDCYGCTELGPLSVMPAAGLLERPTSSGRPFPGVEIAAFDGGRRLPAGEVGLLRARTPLAFAGYLRAGSDGPDGSGAGWATVGDLGRVDADGYVHLADRVDDMILSGGVNVFPADVEAVLREHPAVRDCAVVGLPDPEWGQAVCAVVVPAGPVDLAGLRDWMRSRLAADKLPRRLVLVDRLPTTATEKVARRLLRDRLAVSAAGSGPASP